MNPDEFSMDCYNQTSNQGFPVLQGFPIPHEAPGRTPSRREIGLEHRSSLSSGFDSTLQIESSSNLDLDHARPNKRQRMDSALTDSREQLADYQRSWGFQQMVNQQASNRQYQMVRSLAQEKEDLMQKNASYRDELNLLRKKNEESEGQNNRLFERIQDLYQEQQRSLQVNQELQKRSNWLSRENQRLIGESIQSLDAHFRELKQKDTDISELNERIRTQEDKLTTLATSARNKTSAYHTVQEKLATVEANSSERIRWLETCLALSKLDFKTLEDRAHAAKTKYETRLQKLGGFVLVEQETVQRTSDELQGYVESMVTEILKHDAALSRAEHAYRVKDNEVTTLGEQITGQSAEIIGLKAVIAEGELRLAEATSWADQKITTLNNRVTSQNTEIDNLNSTVATMEAQEQQSRKAFAEKEEECTNSKQKWCDLERAHLALEGRLREREEALESSRAENAETRRKHEEEKIKSDNVLQRDADRKRKEIDGYKKKIADQNGILETANADLGKLRLQEWKFNQESHRHQKEKAESEAKILGLEKEASAAWQQATVLQSELDKNRDIISKVAGLVT